MLPDSDVVRLRHMLDAALEAMEFTEGRSRSDLETNRMLARAIVRDIELIGEAASKVSSETREKHTAIPWVAIITMRNRLIHGYFDIDLDRVWDTVTDDLPPLAAELRLMLNSLEQEE